jgi:hypothetical protein
VPITLSPHIASARVLTLVYMAYSSTAQIRMRMGIGMFLLAFFFAISVLLSLLFAISLFAPAHAEQIQDGKYSMIGYRHSFSV